MRYSLFGFMTGLVSRLFAKLLEFYGCQRIDKQQKRKFNNLSDSEGPYEIWKGSSRYILGNIFVNSERFEAGEKEAVFLHEMGHMRDKSGLKLSLMVLAGVGVGFAVYMITYFLLLLSGYAWGFERMVYVLEHTYFVRGLFIICALVGVDLVFRRFYPGFEYRADEYAVKNGYSDELISALNTEVDTRGNRILVWIGGRYYPTLDSRIDRIRKDSL